MCGIIGYIGNQQAVPVLLEGLKRLEYRGYDSSGIATLKADSEMQLYKSEGKVENLESLLQHAALKDNMGIGHTRWATHGPATTKNAHPHLSADAQLAMVHNGIIENYDVLRTELRQEGISFASDTDTEVLVQLIGSIRAKNGKDTLKALQEALFRVKGSYAIALMDQEQPDRIWLARNGSPLLIGIGENDLYFASDATAISSSVKHVIYPDHGEIAILHRQGEFSFQKLDGTPVSHELHPLQAKDVHAGKGSFPHYMLKEIFEQPRTLSDCMQSRIDKRTNEVVFNELAGFEDHFRAFKRIVIVACGTSWHAGLVAKQLIEQYCRIPVSVEYASEFRYGFPVITDSDLLIAISQSGETADTLAAVEAAHKTGAFIYGISNVPGSSLDRLAHVASHLEIGPEIGVASTKAFTAQVLFFELFVLYLARLRGMLSQEECLPILSELLALPLYVEQILQQNDHIRQMSRRLSFVRNFIYLGRGLLYPLALEGALKLKEISYIHAEGHPAAEMKHGPIALVDAEMPIVCLVPRNALYEKAISNLQEVKARKGFILAVATEGDDTIHRMADEVIYIPATHPSVEPLLTAIPLQLLAYHIAVAKQCDVDRPRNLAKSVTVE